MGAAAVRSPASVGAMSESATTAWLLNQPTNERGTIPWLRKQLRHHNVRETLSICDRAYIIKDGGIIKHGPPEEIAVDPQVREIYLGENFQLR